MFGELSYEKRVTEISFPLFFLSYWLNNVFKQLWKSRYIVRYLSCQITSFFFFS